MMLNRRVEIQAFIEDQTAQLTFADGHKEVMNGDSNRRLKHRLVGRALQEAKVTGEAVRLVSSSADGVVSIVVNQDGTLDEGEPVPYLNRPMPVISIAPKSEAAPSDVVTVAPEFPVPRDRASFLALERQVLPPEEGWRGLLHRTTGITLAPAPSELMRRENIHMVSQHWPGPRKISVVNGKGGVGKTMTTACLAAVFARYGGAGVLAWDNNDTRGTLGWRTEQGPHDATIQDLLAAAEGLLSPHAQVSELARFVHHQTVDKYEVLRSNPQLLAAKQRIGRPEFDALHEVAAKYLRMIIFDSGNDESADRWLGMIDHTDQLVVATTTAPESAESAALLLDALRERDERSAKLAANAVVVISRSESGTQVGEVDLLKTAFKSIARVAVGIPFDPALKSGPIRFTALNRTTQNAWLAAGAAVAEGL